MGRMISATYQMGKQDFTIAEVAAGVVIGTDDRLRLFVGTNLEARRVEVNNHAKQLFDALIEDSVPIPFLPGEFTTYDMLIGESKQDIRKTLSAAVPLLTENSIALFFGETFIMADSGAAGLNPGKSQIVQGLWFKIQEAYLEDRKAA